MHLLPLKVVHRCIGFCDVANILEGTTGQHPSECEDDFPKIVECMAGNLTYILCYFETENYIYIYIYIYI